MLKHFLILLFFIPTLAYASYTISPLRVTLTQEDKIGALTLQSDKSTAEKFQLILYKEIIKEQKKIYLESDDLLITPLMFTIEPGAQQLIRVALKDVSTTAPATYRLYIKELPGTKQPANTVRMIMEFGVPIYVINRGTPQ